MFSLEIKFYKSLKSTRYVSLLHHFLFKFMLTRDDIRRKRVDLVEFEPLSEKARQGDANRKEAC